MLPALARRVAHAGLRLHVANLTNAPEADSQVCLLLDQGFKAYHGIPLLAEGKVRGVLECFHRTAMDTDTEWLGFAGMLAAHAAIAIVNAALLEGLRHSNDELRAAYDSTIEGWGEHWICAIMRPRGTSAGSRRWRCVWLASSE